MSHVKAGSSTKLGRDSAGQRLGVKRFGGQSVPAGQIIVRQRGTKIAAGVGTATGRDQTIYATKPGVVTFKETRTRRFTSLSKSKTTVSVQ